MENIKIIKNGGVFTPQAIDYLFRSGYSIIFWKKNRKY